MAYPTLSPPRCFRCGAGAEEDDGDAVRLFACFLGRAYTDADGRRTTRTIPIRVCQPCVEGAIRASDRIRATGVADRAGRPKVPPPCRRPKPTREQAAAWGRLGAAIALADREPVRGPSGRYAGSRPKVVELRLVKTG